MTLSELAQWRINEIRLHPEKVAQINAEFNQKRAELQSNKTLQEYKQLEKIELPLPKQEVCTAFPYIKGTDPYVIAATAQGFQWS